MPLHRLSDEGAADGTATQVIVAMRVSECAFLGQRTDLLLYVCHLCGLALGSGLPLTCPIARVVAATAATSAIASSIPILVGLVLPVLYVCAALEPKILQSGQVLKGEAAQHTPQVAGGSFWKVSTHMLLQASHIARRTSPDDGNRKPQVASPAGQAGSARSATPETLASVFGSGPRLSAGS